MIVCPGIGLLDSNRNIVPGMTTSLFFLLHNNFFLIIFSNGWFLRFCAAAAAEFFAVLSFEDSGVHGDGLVGVGSRGCEIVIVRGDFPVERIFSALFGEDFEAYFDVFFVGFKLKLPPAIRTFMQLVALPLYLLPSLLVGRHHLL